MQEQLDAIAETLLGLVRDRSRVRAEVAFLRRALARAEVQCYQAEAQVVRAEQQQRLLLTRIDCPISDGD